MHVAFSLPWNVTCVKPNKNNVKFLRFTALSSFVLPEFSQSGTCWTITLSLSFALTRSFVVPSEAVFVFTEATNTFFTYFNFTVAQLEVNFQGFILLIRDKIGVVILF